ncbi:MAG: hypothetical protein WC671_03005 [Candidatus Paceibacterota bacterium]|jgi:hypothetical protein
MSNNVKIFILIICLLVLGVIATVLLRSDSIPLGPGKYDEFATCLKDKGAIFYGAFWCTHCQEQKKLFGVSQKLLPYVECSTADGQSQTQICKDNKITSYPTWTFADETSLNGEISLQQLADKTSCILPQQ